MHRTSHFGPGMLMRRLILRFLSYRTVFENQEDIRTKFPGIQFVLHFSMLVLNPNH